MIQSTIGIIYLTFLFLIIATSFSLIYHPAKFFHLTHAIVITLGAYFTFLFVNQFLLPFKVSVIAAIASAATIGLLCEILFYRLMRKRDAPALAYLIASIGLYTVLQNCISLSSATIRKLLEQAK